jgi:signal transduction histidine kinase
MLEQILFVVIVLTVGTLMAVDVVRTRHEGFHGYAAEGQPHDARPPIAVAGRGSREAFSPAHAGTAMPVATYDAGLAQPPAGVSPAAGGDQRPDAAAGPVPGGSRRGLRDWPVRSRLLLLVSISLAAAAVVAFCISYMIDVLPGTQGNSANDRSILSALAAGAVIIIVVALASWLTIVVARSVVQPLYRLRTGALQLAGPRLAEAVRRASQNNSNPDSAQLGLKPTDVDASDEMGDIARAFDGMGRELLRLAVGEGTHHSKVNATFVDVSHRGQSLMERQIRLLQHLEQGEPDAERLATLFRVRRIGSRMHRYSENLLILVGHEPASGWNQSVALANVIRAAVSEIEEYQRVSLNAQPDVAIVGPAVNDVVHLLIELTENATSFSAADMQVDISGRALTSGGVLLDISDRGVGMTPKELAYANWRLENPPTADTNMPKWIGLLVVARLAARHGVRVRLQPADFGGLTALVWLPEEILTQPGAMVAARPGGFAGAGSRRGLHAAVSDPGYATAQRGVATERFAPSSGEPWDDPLNQRSVPDAGPPSAEPRPPAVRPPAARPALYAELPATIASPIPERPKTLGKRAAVPAQPDPEVTGTRPGPADPASQGPGSAADVIVPPAGDPGGEQRLPVFNAVESHWFNQGRNSLTAPGQSSATASPWSSPADAGWRAASAADSPSSAGSTPVGLPKRLPNANLVPGAIPAAEPAVPVVPNRSAAAARERLASLQRGIDKGRAATRQAARPGEDKEARPGTPD